MLVTQFLFLPLRSFKTGRAPAHNIACISTAVHCTVKDLHPFCDVHVKEALKPYVCICCTDPLSLQPKFVSSRQTIFHETQLMLLYDYDTQK